MSIAAISAASTSPASAAQRTAIIQAAAARNAQQASKAVDPDGDGDIDAGQAVDVDKSGKLGHNINLTA